MTSLFKTALALTGAAAITLSTQALSQSTDKTLITNLLQQGLVEGNTTFIKENVAPNYIQHNPTAADGQEGLLGFVSYLKTLKNPITINPVRVLQEGDLVLVHSEYSMDGPKATFDLFRIADGKVAEHWDVIQAIPEKTASGRSMTDGPTEITDLEKTAENKAIAVNFVTDILMNGEVDKLPNYIGKVYKQHNPQVADGLEGLGNFMGYLAEHKIAFGYTQVHNVVAEGNFVFVQSEGDFGGQATAFNDLFRIDGGLIVEHWDTIQEIPAEMPHSNGMF